MAMHIEDIIEKVDLSDVIHSSGYGKAQSSGRIGVASSQSFRDRMSARRNRIRAYADSKVANQQYDNRRGLSELANKDSEIINQNREDRFKKLEPEQPRKRMKRDFDNINQSGIANSHGLREAGLSASSTRKSFYDVRPNFK